MTLLIPKTSFHLLGARPSIQGVVIFDCFWQALGAYLASQGDAEILSVPRVAFKTEVMNNGRVELFSDNGEDQPGPAKPAAEMICQTSQGKITLSFFEDPQDLVTQRSQDDAVAKMVTNFELLDSFSAQARLNGVQTFPQLLSGMVRVNRMAHEASVPAWSGQPRIRWLYSTNLTPLPDPDPASPARVTIRPLRSMPLGPRTCTLNQINVQWGNTEMTSQMCFDF